jgi:hypothetical protein
MKIKVEFEVTPPKEDKWEMTYMTIRTWLLNGSKKSKYNIDNVAIKEMK